MPTVLLKKMARIHDLIHSAAYKFATKAWHRLHRDEDEGTSDSVKLSPTEYFRFCRAFNRVELFYNLFSKRMKVVDSVIQSTVLSEGRNLWFFNKHTPWENEQIACVHDFLESEIAKGLDIHKPQSLLV
ncbi:hypothetical protein LZ31DRAFT_182901 [Colletotrichum somersetense]|nr:hypothetical protein LZ31DRAFT_182901 [Colletotrichum somersetense]